MLRKRQNSRRTPAKRLKRPLRAKSISKLMREADKLFSLLVRKKGLQGDLQTCFTCGHVSHWKKLHAGHYLSRYYKAARWNRDNVRPQCFVCNIYKKGDVIMFRRNLIKEIGEARVLAVEALRDAPIKLTREYLENLLLQLSNTS